MKLDCGHEPSEHSDFTTGYGEDSEGKTYCYACCAERDKAQMIADGRATLYLTTYEAGTVAKAVCGPWGTRLDCGKVSNWPGSLSFETYRLRIGRHNIAGRRYDVWFTGPDGKQWHGVQYGDNTQLCHCKRSK